MLTDVDCTCCLMTFALLNEISTIRRRRKIFSSFAVEVDIHDLDSQIVNSIALQTPTSADDYFDFFISANDICVEMRNIALSACSRRNALPSWYYCLYAPRTAVMYFFFQQNALLTLHRHCAMKV